LKLFLVHHGEAVGPEVDTRRPLSIRGEINARTVASEAAVRGAKPAIVWHSGKLRARQTAEAFWRACNALAEFSAAPDLQPSDPPFRLRDRLIGQTGDILIAGHFPHLPRLLTLLLSAAEEPLMHFPEHGIVALESTDQGQTWKELWRVESP
jgi:phosphohistidine phosphatase